MKPYKQEDFIMKKELKGIINLIFAAVALAMGVAVIVLSIVNKDLSVNDFVRMLGIAVASLGLFALNNLPK